MARVSAFRGLEEDEMREEGWLVEVIGGCEGRGRGAGMCGKQW
jgi:hypothetical protein